MISDKSKSKRSVCLIWSCYSAKAKGGGGEALLSQLG